MPDDKEFVIKDDTSPSADTAGPDPGPEVQLPEVNFSTFIISLNASALVNLGVLADPATGQKQKSLALGKQTIDIMAMLEEKTRGNLTSEEEGLLKNLLYDLRLVYVREKG